MYIYIYILNKYPYMYPYMVLCKCIFTLISFPVQRHHRYQTVYPASKLTPPGDLLLRQSGFQTDDRRHHG